MHRYYQCLKEETMAAKRKDKNRVVLRKDESYRESDERYCYRWTDVTGKRRVAYALWGIQT